MKRNIQSHLDKIHGKLVNALIETEQKSINEIRKHVPSLESNMKEIVEEQENLAKFKNHASKAFVCVKKMEDRVAAKTKFLGSLKQQNVSDRITISVNLGPTSNDFTKNITSLGKIVLKKEPVEISFKSVLPAQILVTPFACYRSFESINVSLEKTKKTLYFSNPDNTGTVTCCDFHGNVKWVFRDNILQNPSGTGVDSHGNVYVAGIQTDNIVAISADGKRCRELLTKENGIDKPRALCFDKKRNKLLVANTFNKKVFLFSVEKVA